MKRIHVAGLLCAFLVIATKVSAAVPAPVATRTARSKV
jgi:hypothetical protein